jgi:glycosyltransferase involved in cell wall biosynthesis
VRVVISGAGRDWRGTESDTLILAHGLRKRGHEVMVFCRPGSALQDRLNGDGIPSAPILGARDFDPRTIARCIAALGEHHTQVVIIQKDKDLRLTGIAAWTRHLPVLVRHVADRPLKPGLRYRFLFGRVATHHVAISAATRATLLASAPWLSRDVPVIHNGIDIPRFRDAAHADLGLPDDAIAIGYLGAFETRKGILDFAEAWRLVSEQIPNAYAVIAGAGQREDRFKAALEGVPRVHWLGFRRDAPNVMKALDVFVLPSHFEGFGLVLVEAMAAGVATVAYATSAIPELVDNGVTGLLAPVGNVEALAAAIESLCRSPELRLGIATAGQAHAQAHFGADRMVDEHEALLEQIVEDWHRARNSPERDTNGTDR